MSEHIENLYDQLQTQDKVIDDQIEHLRSMRQQRIKMYYELRDAVLATGEDFEFDHMGNTVTLKITQYGGFSDNVLDIQTTKASPRDQSMKPQFGDTTYDKPTRRNRAK